MSTSNTKHLYTTSGLTHLILSLPIGLNTIIIITTLKEKNSFLKMLIKKMNVKQLQRLELLQYHSGNTFLRIISQKQGKCHLKNAMILVIHLDRRHYRFGIQNIIIHPKLKHRRMPKNPTATHIILHTMTLIITITIMDIPQCIDLCTITATEMKMLIVILQQKSLTRFKLNLIQNQKNLIQT